MIQAKHPHILLNHNHECDTSEPADEACIAKLHVAGGKLYRLMGQRMSNRPPKEHCSPGSGQQEMPGLAHSNLGCRRDPSEGAAP